MMMMSSSHPQDLSQTFDSWWKPNFTDMRGRVPPISGPQTFCRRPTGARDMLDGHQSKTDVEYDSRFGFVKVVGLLSFTTRHIS